MSCDAFNQLVGSLHVFLAPCGTAPPEVQVEPADPWLRFGPTDGGQKIDDSATMTYFRDDDHMVPTAVVQSDQTVKIDMTIIGMSLEQQSKIQNSAEKVRDLVGTTVPTRRMPLKRLVWPQQYAMLLRGQALSPYGQYPGQYYIPRGVFDGNRTREHTKVGRVSLSVSFNLLEDTEQEHADDTLGWLDVQTGDPTP